MFVAHGGISADDDDDDEGLKGVLSALSNLDDGNPSETFINPVRDSTEVCLSDFNTFVYFSII